MPKALRLECDRSRIALNYTTRSLVERSPHYNGQVVKHVVKSESRLKVQMRAQVFHLMDPIR